MHDEGGKKKFRGHFGENMYSTPTRHSFSNGLSRPDLALGPMCHTHAQIITPTSIVELRTTSDIGYLYPYRKAPGTGKKLQIPTSSHKTYGKRNLFGSQAFIKVGLKDGSVVLLYLFASHRNLLLHQ